MLLVSKRSEQDIIRGNSIENLGYWFICLDVRISFLYFDPGIFCPIIYNNSVF